MVNVVKETIDKSNFSSLKVGDVVNIERSMMLNDRLDGHIVQGHVDQIAECISIDENGGSYVMTFLYEKSNNVTVEKGSICVNGISLTVCNSQENSFSVAIIPSGSKPVIGEATIEYISFANGIPTTEKITNSRKVFKILLRSSIK